MTADKTYILTRDGKIAGDGEGVQIALEGCDVDDAVAEKYGLPRDYDGPQAPADEAEKAHEEPENKSVPDGDVEKKSPKARKGK